MFDVEEFLVPINGGLFASASFDTFVVGPSNADAVDVARRHAMLPLDEGRKSVPLVITGQTGMGKTHLLYAVAKEQAGRNSGARILFIPADRLANLWLSDAEQLTHHLRSIDAIYIDAVNFIAKSSYQGLSDALAGAGNVGGATIDEAEILSGLSDALFRRLRNARAVSLAAPTPAEATRLLDEVSVQRGASLSQELATNAAGLLPNGTPRKIEATLCRAMALANLQHRAVSLDDFRRATVA